MVRSVVLWYVVLWFRFIFVEGCIVGGCIVVRFIFSDIVLNCYPSFIEGVGRVLDIGNGMGNVVGEYDFSKGDLEVLRRIWRLWGRILGL